MSQNGKEVVMDKYQDWHYTRASHPFDKEVFVLANQKVDDSWLRKDLCSGSCDSNPTQTISNIKIT